MNTVSHLLDNSDDSVTNATNLAPAGLPVDLTRRAFCGGLCRSVVGAAGVLALGGCGNGSGTQSTLGAAITPTREADGSWRVPGGGRLAPFAGLAFSIAEGEDAGATKPVVLIADGKKELTAFSALCTHAGCTVLYEAEPAGTGAGVLICPCHASRFDAAGRVLNGPATQPLKRYQVRRSGEDALIKVS